MLDPPIPLVILGGRDRRAPHLPAAGRGKHPLVGYKALDVRVGRRPLIAVLVERLRAVGGFDPIFIAGPARIYEEAVPEVHSIDTDGDLGENIRKAIEALAVRHPSGQIAFTTCDILPEPEELQELLTHFQASRPCDFWMPMIRVADGGAGLGASAWKPQYRFRSGSGDRPEPTLPGHLVIVDPGALRLELVYRLFELAYRTRNRSVTYRRAVMLRGVLLHLLGCDLRRLVRLRPPTTTFEVVYHGLRFADEVRRGDTDTEALAERVRHLLVRREHRRSHPDRSGWLPVLDGLSLAKDVDTVEEAREMARHAGGDAAAP